MPCVFEIKPENRHCKYCPAEHCDEREPKDTETHATTQEWYIQQIENGNNSTNI